MGGGTLSLIQGGYLDANGELDLTNSTLSLSGPFLNNGGQLITSASTLTLNKNTLFSLGMTAVFDNYNPNGWGLVLYSNSTTQAPPQVTLGKTGGTIVLEPNANAHQVDLLYGIIVTRMLYTASTVTQSVLPPMIQPLTYLERFNLKTMQK